MPAPAFRIVFLGSPTFALPTLEALLGAGHDVALVVSQPDRPRGRGRQVQAPPVARHAREHALPLWQTDSLRGKEAQERLSAVRADAMVLAAFGALVPGPLLGAASLGILNVHPSLLPRWRGAAPIPAALLAGDAITGVSIIRLVQAMDAGPILAQERLVIAPDDDALSLESSLAQIGARLAVRTLADLAVGRAEERPQDETSATFCRKIVRDDARIDWTQPADTIWRQVRAYRVWPQAFTTSNGRLLKLLRARPVRLPSAAPPGTAMALEGGGLAVATGARTKGLEVLEVVPEGKRPQSGSDFLRGQSGLAGSRLGE